MAGLSAEQIRRWTERTCAEQQVPVAVTDPLTIARIGDLLGRDGCAAAGGRAAPGPALQPPDRTNAVGIEPVAATLPGTDDGLVEQGGDDGSLAVEVEGGPLTS